MSEDPLNLDTRRRIYDLILSSPGLHFREISRRADISMGVVEYHLNYLVKKEMIIAKTEGRYKRFYAEGKHGSKDKRTLHFLRQEIPRNILIKLLTSPGMRHKELKAEMVISGSTLSFHLKKMIAKEVIQERGEGRKKGYYVVDPDTATQALLEYKGSFMDDLVDVFTDTWLDLNI